MTQQPGSEAEPISWRGVSAHARNLLTAGFPREAARHEAQLFLSRVQSLSERPDLDGQSLIEAVFKDHDLILAFDERVTVLERDKHAGFRHLALGMHRAVRNTYTHDVETEVSSEEGALWLSLLGWLNTQLETAYIVAAASDGLDEDDEEEEF